MDKKEAGAIWMRISEKGNVFYSGHVFGKQIVMFPVSEEKRSENPKLPAFRIFESEDRRNQ